MEAQLRTASQDSIASTGSNQELKLQLDSTIAQVDAFAKELERNKKTSTASLPAKDLKQTPSGSRLASERKMSVEVGGARPRVPIATPRSTPKSSLESTSAATTSAAENNVGFVLKQSSWGSRDQALNANTDVLGGAAAAANTPALNSREDTESFALNRSQWERRTSNSTPIPNNHPGAAVKSNREFWKHKENSSPALKKQTPDLVLDLPTTSATSSASSSNSSTPSSSTAPKPKPRSLNNTLTKTPEREESPPAAAADNFAKSDSDTIERQQVRRGSAQLRPAGAASNGTTAAAGRESPSSGGSSSLLRRATPLQQQPTGVTPRPQVRVKPLVQNRKVSLTGEEQEEVSKRLAGKK